MRILLLLLLIGTLTSCDRIDREIELSCAVVTGRKISSISILNPKDGLLHKYEYTYDSSGNVTSVDNDGVHYIYLYDNAKLVNISCDNSSNNSWTLTYDPSDNLKEYSVYADGDFLVKYTFDYEENRIACLNVLCDEDSDVPAKTMYYVWKDLNIYRIGEIEFTYTEIINNFNVPIPELHFPSYGLFLEPLFSTFFCSNNMIYSSYTSSLNQFTYLRNSEGDISRINVDNGRLYYIIEYL